MHHEKHGRARLLKRLLAAVICILMLFAPAAVYAAEEYSTEGTNTDGSKWKWTLLSDENEAVKTYGMDTDNDTSNGYEITLVMDGNEWTYYFSVINAGAEYYVTETLTDAYKSKYKLYDEDGTLQPLYFTKMEAGSAKVTLVNKDDTKYGSLSIKKNLTNYQGNAVSGDNTLFAFEITLSYTKPSSSTNDISGMLKGTQNYGNVSFTWNADGAETGNYTATSKIYLKAGETAEMTYIPAGVSYTITETTSGYETSWRGTSTDTSSSSSAPTDLKFTGNPTGTITNSYAYDYICTNKQPEPTKPPEPVKTGDVIVKKTVKNASGTVDTSDETEFNFKTVFSGLSSSSTYTYEKYIIGSDNAATLDSNGGGKLSVLADGSAVASFTLKNNQYILFKELPVGCTYQVQEEASDYIASYTLSGYTQTASSQDANTEKNTSLTTFVETLDEGEARPDSGEYTPVTVLFTNTNESKSDEKVIDIDVKKVWNDGGADHTGDAITLNLMRVDTKAELEACLSGESNDPGDMVQTVKLDGVIDNKETTAWKYTFKDLPLYRDNGEPNYYYIAEEEFSGYYHTLEYETTSDEANKDIYTHYSYTVTNTVYTDLPSTGGPGTTPFYIAGGAIIMAAMFVLVLKNKRQGYN